MGDDGAPEPARSAAGPVAPDRRSVLGGLVAVAATLGPVRGLADGTPLRFGLTPVFLTNDLRLLTDLEAYLERATGRPVQLVMRRTYQEITALLVSGQLDAAWICGFPFVQFRERLSLVAVPIWRGEPLYRSYLIVRSGRPASILEDLAGDLHAFSDPDSNSGYLVTRALLAERGSAPDTFFRKTIFTYGHRNVVRAVASGLAQSGSVDGYVLEVLREVEPDLADHVSVFRASEWLAFPPVAAPAAARDSGTTRAIRSALLGMADDEAGRTILATLRLDGFEEHAATLFDPIARKVALVGRLD